MKEKSKKENPIQKIEKLRSLSRCLNLDEPLELKKHTKIANQVYQLAKELGQDHAINEAITEKSRILIHEGRFCEAITMVENRIKKSLNDLDLIQIWNMTLGRVLEQMNKLADSAPETAEFGRTYEKLIKLGYVSSKLHIGAVNHYLASDKIPEATEILLKLLKIWPNSPGVLEALCKLRKISDDVRLSDFNSEDLCK